MAPARDPRIDPRPGDILEIDGHRYEVWARRGYWVETAGPPLAGDDTGRRLTSVRLFAAAARDAVLIRAAQVPA